MILIWLQDRRPLETKKSLSVTLVAARDFFVSRGLALYGGESLLRTCSGIYLDNWKNRVKKRSCLLFSKTTFSKNNINAADGTRTHMVSRTILSRMRLPIPPQRHIEISYNHITNFYMLSLNSVFVKINIKEFFFCKITTFHHNIFSYHYYNKNQIPSSQSERHICCLLRHSPQVHRQPDPDLLR